jgi:hypothetical protein
MVAAGDDTQAATWALAAHIASAANNNYTIEGFTPAGNPFAAMNDVRGGLPIELAHLWVVWDNTPLPNTNVWCYLTLPTIVAARGYYAVPRALNLIDPLVQGTPGMNLLAPILPPDAPFLPPPIYNAIAHAVLNAAMIGETPAQALAENTKILAMPPAPPAAYGYGPGPLGFPVQSFFGPQIHFPVAFAIGGLDPITKLPVLPAKTTALAKSLVVPVVNATNNVPPGGIGSFIGARHNLLLPCKTLALSLSGALDTTQAFGVAAAGNPLTVLLDDPLSDSWYVMETQAYHACAAIPDSQEIGVAPPGPPFDPLNLLGPGGVRQRVEGSKQALGVEGITPDSLTYASFTCRTAGAGTYVSVNAKDPFLGLGFGNIPACPVATNPAYSLRALQNVVTKNPVPPGINALIGPVKAIVGANLNWQ